LFVLVAAALALAAQAGAVPVIPAGYNLNISVTDTNGAVGDVALADLLSALTETPNPDSSVTLALSSTHYETGYQITSWSSTYKLDPFVTNNFQVVNNSNFTQTYDVLITSPVTPNQNVDTILQSNVLLQINDDDNAGGATLTNVTPNHVYVGLINGMSTLTFLADPYTLSCTDPFDCAVLGNGQDAAGVASQGITPVFATSIGIRIRFTLTPHDSASVQSRFEVVSTPEPGAPLLLGAAAALLVVWRRRSAR
jgi:hypothetical protein